MSNYLSFIKHTATIFFFILCYGSKSQSYMLPWKADYYSSTGNFTLVNPKLSFSGIQKNPTWISLIVNHQNISSNPNLTSNFNMRPEQITFRVGNGTWYYGGAPMAMAAAVQIQGGDLSGFSSIVYHGIDWKQNIQSVVNRANTVSYVVNYNGNDRFFVGGTGGAFGSSFWAGSDLSFKREIKNIDNSLSKIMNLQGVSFKLKKEELCNGCNKDSIVLQNDTTTHIGFIAQEIEKVVPEVVRTSYNNKKYIAYQNLTALLVEAIKELNQKIDKHLNKTNEAIQLIPKGYLYQNKPIQKSEEFLIKFNLQKLDTKTKIIIYNSDGEEIFQNEIFKNSTVKIDLKNKKQGHYYYSLWQDDLLIDIKMQIIKK